MSTRHAQTPRADDQQVEDEPGPTQVLRLLQGGRHEGGAKKMGSWAEYRPRVATSGPCSCHGTALAFGAPLVIRDPGCDELVTVHSVDEALAILARAGPLRLGEDGVERSDWSHALDCVTSAKFEATPDCVEAARVAFRLYAEAVGVLVSLRSKTSGSLRELPPAPCCGET